MKIAIQKSEQDNIDSLWDELFTLESLLKLVKKSQLFELLKNSSTEFLEQERNDYINIINIALDKIDNLKELNFQLEKDAIYKSTPTIAADK